MAGLQSQAAAWVRLGSMATRCGASLGLLLLLAACGGGGGGGPTFVTPYFASAAGTGVSVSLAAAPNVMPITVARGPNGRGFNTPFVSVTVCRPGTDICQVLDKVLLDTGSDGLRIVASALRPELQLPPVTDAAGHPMAECAHFASGHAWGSVQRADVWLAGQRAAGVPIQLYEQRALPYGAEPASCATTPSVASVLDANGILGIGLRRHDCGEPCEGASPPARYFSCAAGTCQVSPLPRADQVLNPVAALASHNNGVSVILPPVPLGGSDSITGALVLGIGTLPNNQLGAAEIFTPDAAGFLRTTYQGRTIPSFLDTGSNSLLFADPQLPVCGDMYCPPAPTVRTAEITAAGGSARSIDFTLDRVQFAMDVVGASIGGGTRDYAFFNWGLPFFYGRTVHVAIEGAQTPAGVGPYWAF